ncbi:MAG TPA: heparan-alpha-glucosaminide N-acetyltransferase domain-containing protein [Vicinamibacterales bacterium]
MTPPRLVSIDVFRGLTMAAMVIVNNPGDWGHVYAPLLHAPWHGLTPTDLIFPFFLFIVGVSITLAKRSSATYATILRRALLIFALGMLLALYPRFDFSTVRIPGVLQRIAVCYLAVASIHRFASTDGTTNLQRAYGAFVGGLFLSYLHWTWLGADLSPDGNVGARIDRWVFGDHLWRQSRTWDPEGLFSTIPAIGTTMMGVSAGYVMASLETERFKLRLLTLMGVLSLALGSAWSFILPLNKSLWTGSYVLVTAGLALLLLAALRWGLDRDEPPRPRDPWGRPDRTPEPLPRRLAHPFIIMGRNALLLFVVSGLLAKTLGLIRVDNGQGGTLALGRWIYLSWFAPLADPKNASLLYAFANLAVLFLLLWWLHRRRWYFKV